jgi:hypothetical protein
MAISLSDTTGNARGASGPPESIKNPNPQGKGLVPLLRDWQTVQPAFCGQRSAVDFLRDYCVSSLVLAAQFRFKPVVGVPYFLYCGQQGWMLSLVGPDEWGQRLPGEYLARCRLRADMTWALEAAALDEHSLTTSRSTRGSCRTTRDCSQPHWHRRCSVRCRIRAMTCRRCSPRSRDRSLSTGLARDDQNQVAHLPAVLGQAGLIDQDVRGDQVHPVIHPHVHVATRYGTRNT